MLVARDTVNQLMVELGYKTADKWDDDRALEKLKSALPKIDDETAEGVEDVDAKKLLAKLMKDAKLVESLEIEAAEEEDEEEETAPAKKGKKPAGKKKPAKVEEEEEDDEEEPEEDEEESDEDEEEASDEEEDDEDEKPAKKGKGKKAPVAKKGKKPVKAKKDAVERDAFGNRLDTQAHEINAAISKKPKTAVQIAKDSGQKSYRVHAHLQWLVERKFVKKTETAKGNTAYVIKA